jgi:hypothetical protein
MRIFVAYGYNPRDTWIEPVVKPLIEAFGSEVIDGRELAGQIITDAVRESIRNSDALMAFFTRRDPKPDGTWETHKWVRDEFVVAFDNQKQLLPIYEDGVPIEPGITGRDRQYLTYTEAARVDCVVNIVKALGRWHRRGIRRFQLVPDSAIRPHLSKQYFRCRYRVMEGYDESPLRDVPVQRIQGGLFISAPDLSRDSMVQVEIVTDNAVISSDYTPIDAIAIQLNG